MITALYLHKELLSINKKKQKFIFFPNAKLTKTRLPVSLKTKSYHQGHHNACECIGYMFCARLREYYKK